MTTSEVGEFDPGQHLTVRDITVDDIQNPRVVSVRIKQSKTDPFRHGTSIVLSRTDLPLCPVAALLAYLVVRGGDRDGPLFLFRGQPLTRPRLVSELRKALALAGLKPEKYAGHSFRFGAATTAAACGVPVDVIKTLGTWKSQGLPALRQNPGPAARINQQVTGEDAGVTGGGVSVHRSQSGHRLC